MGSRNQLELYDAGYARKQQMLAEPHKYSGGHTGPRQAPPPLSADLQKKLMDALSMEASKVRTRDEERRKRDPTYRADAIELSGELLEYDKYVDYYEVLKVDQFASAGEIKAAFKKLSLELHPDKVRDKSETERATAKEKFLQLTQAHNILADLATRRSYDQARDHMDARNDSGLIDPGKCERPPPTCVDVELTLENLYRGTRKQVHFTRNEFKGTRYAKTTQDYYNVKINRGELEGAAIWYKMAGDVGPFGRCDLVFCVKQAPHPVFERLGDDLWYYEREPAGWDDLFFVCWVPTFASTPTSAKHELHPKLNQVVAFGHTLACAFGYDRSGLGEVIVPGHGMPLRPESQAEEGGGLGGRTMGDLIVKVPIEAAPVQVPARRVYLPDGLPMPPICLLTSDAHGALDASAAGVLLSHTLLPHVMLQRARDLERRRLGWHAPAHAGLRPAVCLLVGGDGEAAAHAEAASIGAGRMLSPPLPRAAAQLMRLLSSALPQLTWRTILATPHVAEPLLADEVAAVEGASLLLLVALPDACVPRPSRHDRHAAAVSAAAANAGGGGRPSGSTPPPPSAATADPPVADPSHSANSATARPPRPSSLLAPLPMRSETSTHLQHLPARLADEMAAWPPQPCSWEVVQAPGLRLRRSASIDAPVLGVLRCGAAVQASAVDAISVLWHAHYGAWLRVFGPAGKREQEIGYVQVVSAAGEVHLRPHSVSATAQGGAVKGGGGGEATAAAATEQAKAAAETVAAAEEAAGGLSGIAYVGGLSGSHTRLSASEDDFGEQMTAEMTRRVMARDRKEQLLADAEEAEDAAWAAEGVVKYPASAAALDEKYLDAGCATAAVLMRHVVGPSVLRCHCDGGVVVGLDEGCALLGHAGRREYAAPAEEAETSRLTLAELRVIREESLADDLPIHYAKMCLWSAEQASTPDCL